ncbi:MAG: hypothetical protein VB036_08840 [Propionicimonas sp.]|nr:hypothetical protein [Propionicimonas sp.]
MTDTAELDEDPWAWLYAQDGDDGPAWADVVVTAVVEPVPGGNVERCRREVEAGDVVPDQIVVDDPDPGSAADWLWLLTADCEPSPGALKHLLVALDRNPDLDVVGPLLVEPRRHGPGIVIAQYGQTISSNGRLRSLVPSGELYQGQLERADALGVDAAGMLVRGDVWRELGGFNRDLPHAFRGIDFGWRATLAGHRVAVEPAAQVVVHAEPLDLGDARAAGLAVVGAHLTPGRRLLGRLRLAVMSLLASLAFLLGKDGARAAGEITGLGRWIGRRRLRRSVALTARQVSSTPQTRARARSLRPARGAGLRRGLEGAAERISEWLASFSGPTDAPSLDELTGDEFAGVRRDQPRISPLVVGLVLTVLLAAGAGRALFRAGSLQGPWLLPAPASWLTLVQEYVAPIAGQPALHTPGWTGLMGLASFVTGGQPEWLVSILVMGCVPLAWLAAFRLLNQTVASHVLAGIAAFGYALAPVLAGGLNVGSTGLVVFAVLLPVYVYRVRFWLSQEETTWRAAAGLGVWGLLLTAVFPPSWVLLVIGLVVVTLGRPVRTWLQLVLAAAAPLLLLVGPWRETLLAYPGRLLTGIEPVMAGLAPPTAWEVLLGRTAGGTPPLWLSLVVVGGLWVVGLVGALRRRGRAAAAFAVAGFASAAAVLVTRLVVQVPPGEWARPSGMELFVVAAGALILAAAWGLDDLSSDLRGANLGLRHVGTLALTVVIAGVLVLAGGWWVLAGETGLHRSGVGSIPPFVRNEQTSPTPGRTLALELRDAEVSWSLLQDDLPRLGDVERGLVASGDPEATRLAASVVTRLTSGSGDDQLLPDLMTLGVSYIWLTGGDAGHRLAISNTPGLGVGTGDRDTVWPVEGSGRAVVVTADGRVVTGNGQELPAGTELRLAEPADSRWQATAGGRELAPVPTAGFGQSFDTTGASGVLEFGLRQGPDWWAWAQLAGLALLILLAAPGLRRAGEPAGPRRVEEQRANQPESAPRRALGGER